MQLLVRSKKLEKGAEASYRRCSSLSGVKFSHNLLLRAKGFVPPLTKATDPNFPFYSPLPHGASPPDVFKHILDKLL